MKHSCLLAFFFLFYTTAFSQNGESIKVSGQVVDVSGGKSVGLPDIKVRVKGYGWTFTDATGHFSITLPSDREYVQFELEGCPYPVISPYHNLINIPPNGKLDIKVCIAENKKLRGRIEELNNKVNALEGQRKLNTRQLAAMHQTLLDTILHLESNISELENDLKKKGAETEAINRQVLVLENEVSRLQGELTNAMEQKYLRQKEVFDQVSAGLLQYMDQAKNLRDNMRPVQINSYFSSPPARERLYESIEKYNAARQEILDNQKSQVASISNYWEAYTLAVELEETYHYLLNKVHNEGVYPMEFAVNDHLKEALSRQISGSKAKKAAEEGATESISKLNPMIEILEQKVNDILFKLKNSL